MHLNYLRYTFNDKLNGYYNREIFAMYTRGFLGALSTHIIQYNYTDVISPFYDVDFLSFCLSISLEHRFGHKLYNAWVVRKYPKAAKFPTINYVGPVRENMYWSKAKRVVKKGPSYAVLGLLRMFGIDPKANPVTMNSIKYCYKTDKNIRKFINSYHFENKQRVQKDKELYLNTKDMYNNGLNILLVVLAAYDLQVLE